MKLKELRQSRGMTLAQISELLGVTVPTYHRWESGTVAPNSSSLMKIARELHVEVVISYENDEITYQEPELVPPRGEDYPDEVWDAALRFAAEIHSIYEEE